MPGRAKRHDGRPTVVVSPDAFKGTLSAREAGALIAQGIQHVLPRARLHLLPLSDGGEDFLDVLLLALSLREVPGLARDPIGRPLSTSWGLRENMAVIEVASASGNLLLSRTERDPLRTTTTGTGDLILAALERSATNVVLGVGGSATVDGGSGALSVLGFAFLDRHGQPIPLGGGGLIALDRIVPPDSLKDLRKVRWTLATDVVNPLLGPRGAAAVFGPQKGASPEMVLHLEEGLANLANAIEALTGVDVKSLPFGGGAGGLPAGFTGLLGADLVAGAEWVLDQLEFDRAIEGADLVITGEGKVDTQTLDGKLVSAVTERTGKAGCPVVIVCGSATLTARDLGADSIYTIGKMENPDLSRTHSQTALPQLGALIAQDFLC